jgi:hypothetical protein
VFGALDAPFNFSERQPHERMVVLLRAGRLEFGGEAAAAIVLHGADGIFKEWGAIRGTPSNSRLSLDRISAASPAAPDA